MYIVNQICSSCDLHVDGVMGQMCGKGKKFWRLVTVLADIVIPVNDWDYDDFVGVEWEYLV